MAVHWTRPNKEQQPVTFETQTCLRSAIVRLTPVSVYASASTLHGVAAPQRSRARQQMIRAHVRLACHRPIGEDSRHVLDQKHHSSGIPTHAAEKRSCARHRPRFHRASTAETKQRRTAKWAPTFLSQRLPDFPESTPDRGPTGLSGRWSFFSICRAQSFNRALPSPRGPAPLPLHPSPPRSNRAPPRPPPPHAERLCVLR